MRKQLLLIIILFQLISSCAVMNTSITETAKTLQPGKIKIGVEYGTGIDLASTVFLKKDPLDVFDNKKLKTSSNFGIKFGKGISEGFEVNGKIWIGSGGVGSRFYTKHRLNGRDQDFNFALMPGIHFVTSEAELFYNSEDIKVPSISVYGFEMPFLVSYRFNPHISYYGAIKYSLDRVEIDYKSIEADDTHTLHRYGLISGVSVRFGELYFRPEWGFEAGKTVNGDFTYMPNFTFGFGMLF